MKLIKSKTVLFVTGAFVSNTGWDTWIEYFKEKGFTAVAPAWPHKDAPALELRKRHPDSALAGLHLSELVDHYIRIIKALPEKPIIIGHSLGGLVTQILISRGYGVAGVAYHSAPPQGILSFEYSFLKSMWGPLDLFGSTKVPYMMPFKHWQYTFTNTMPLKDQQDAYERMIIPESKTTLRDCLGKDAKIDLDKAHEPLLFVSGSADHIMPASLNYKNFKKYKHAGSITEYKDFPGRNHFAMGQPTWKEDADFILNWISK